VSYRVTVEVHKPKVLWFKRQRHKAKLVKDGSSFKVLGGLFEFQERGPHLMVWTPGAKKWQKLYTSGPYCRSFSFEDMHGSLTAEKL
jgi:hypothetical protein